ncbi:AraC family transcriptional regulator [Flavobacterium microcysteis]
MENIPIRHIQENSKEPALSGNFSIRKLEALTNGAHMKESLHRHDFFYMLIITKGAGSHEIDFVPYEVADHSLFLMRPGQVHQLDLQAGSKGYMVQFKNDFFYLQNLPAKELLRKVSHKKICTLEKENFTRLKTILDYIVTEFSEKQEGYEDVIKSSLSIFFIELIRHRRNRDTIAMTDNSYSQEKLERFLDLLETDITSQKQVSYYADKLNLSIYQLGTITKYLLDKTPSEVISEQVVLEAKRLLLATSGQVNQIAYNLGYEDPSYFIRFFKKHTGHSPESYRNISR